MFIFADVTYQSGATDNQFAELLRIAKEEKLTEIQLSFSIEELGVIAADLPERIPEVREFLIPYLDNPSAVVREGAILGLTEIADSDILAVFRAKVDSEPNHALQNLYRDVIYS